MAATPYNFFWKKDDLRVPYGRGKKPDSEKSADVRSEERLMSKSPLPGENKLKAVKLCTGDGMKDLKNLAPLETLVMDPETKSIISGLFANSKENMDKDKDKAPVKVYTRRVGKKVFWDTKLQRHRTWEELEMDPELYRGILAYSDNLRINADNCWDSTELEHPATFEELGMDPENKGIISDFFGFVRAKELYKRIGQAWKKDNWLVYDSPGTGRWSIIAAMANCLKFDIYHLDLTSFSSLKELEYTLLSTRDRSVIAIEGLWQCARMLLNHSAWMFLNLDSDEDTAKRLMMKIDALFSRHNNERIFVFTTNHRDQHDAASVRPVGMDIYFNSLLVSNSEKENTREACDSTKGYPLPNFDATENKAVKVYSRRGRDWSNSRKLEQPPTFVELGKDPENEGIISDLLSFVRNKKLYKRIGKRWKRGYLLYDSPGTDRSSLIAAMASYLKFDIYDLDLTGLSSIQELKSVLTSIKKRSLIAIKDFDHWFGMHPNLKKEVESLRDENELTLSGLFEIIEELLENSLNQQIIVVTTNHNHRDRYHNALLSPLNIDAYMHTSSPQLIALPDGGETVELDSSEQKPLVDFDATNNRAYQSSVLVSNSEKENTRETSKRQCMIESVLSFVAPDYRADLVRAYQNGPIMFTSDNKDTREGLNGECLTKSVLSDDDLTKQELLLERTSLAFTKVASEDIDGLWDSISVDSDSDSDSDSDNFDDGARMLPNLKDEFVDGLSSSCGNERIIVSTTDHRDWHNAALLPMDTYIHKASPQPIGLPDGGEIVQLQSIGEKSLVDFDATNNRDQSGVLVSYSKKKYTLEVSRERCMTQSLLSLVESTRRISTDFDSPDNREHLNSPVVFNSEKEDTREASKGECSTKNALSLDDSTKQNSFPDFDATINKAHLVKAYHCGPVVFLSENKNSGGALNRECIGKSVLCLEDLRQHRGGRCDDVEKSFGAISDLGFHTADSLAWTSFEVLETLAPWEQPNDCVPLLSLGRSTLGSCVQQEKSPDLPRVMQIEAVGQRVTKSSRYLEGFTAQSASSSRWPIGLPDGAHSVLLDPLEQSTQDIVHLAGAEQCSSTVSLPGKKMVRTLKRKYKTISVIVENHQQHKSIALPDGGEIVELDSSVKKPLVDFDATTNMGFQSGVLVSYSKRRCMTLSGVSGFYRTYSLAQKSFEVQETLLPLKQLRNSADTARVRQIRTLSGVLEEPSNRCGSFPIHMHTLIGRFRRYLCPSLCPSICIRSMFWEEPNDFVPLWSPRRLTFKGCVQLEKTPYLPRLLQIDAVEQELTKSPRYSGGSTAQSASSSLWLIGLPDGRHIVVLDPLEQSTKNVAHAARVDQCSPIVSLLKKKMLRKTLKRKCRTMSVIFEIHQQHFGRKCEGSARSFHATCIGKKHGTNQVSTVKRIHKQHRIHQWPFRHKWATRKWYSAGDKRSFQVSRESMNEKLDSRLQFIHMSQCAKADGSGPTVSNLEKGRLREALKCDSLTNTRSLNDLREHFGARRKDAAKGLCDSLALKSFEVLDSLPLGEQSNSIRNLARRRTLTHKHCVRLKKLQDLQQSLLSDCSGELAAQAALGLSDGGHIPSLPEKKIVRKTLKRKSRTMSVLSLEDDQQHVGRRWEDDAKFLGAKRICRQLAIDRKPTKKRILRQHGTCRCQFKQSAIDLPDGGHILSLSKKKIVRKTLKRKCRNMSVLRSEYHQHVDSKWDDAVKSLGAKHIYRQLVIHRVSRAKRIREQHGFHRWPFQRNLATWKGYFLGGERPDDVISLSMDGILVSRLQLIHISWLGRFSPRSPALLPQGEIVEPPLALSSSQLPSTSIRAHLGGQDRSGSSTSQSQNERTRDQPEGRKRKIKNLTIEDLRPYVRLPRAQAARELQTSESSFKRLCRRLKIEQWPKLPPGEEILKPPDPPGRNAGQIGMVNEFGHLPEPIEVSRPPDSRERNTGQTEGENDVVVHVHVQNHLQDYFDSPIGWFEDDSTDLQNVLQGIEVDQVIDEPLLSSAYPNPNPDVFLQPQVALTQMVSGHMGIPNNRRNSLASPAETHFEGHGAVSSNHCSNPNPDVFLQPQVALTQMVSGNMGIPNNQRNSLASPAETRLVGHGAVSSNHCLNPNPDVFLQPQVALTHMVSGNMGIPNNLRNSLASPPETRLEGHGSVSSNHCPNPNPIVFLQPQVALTHMASGHMGIPNNQRNSLSSPAETRLEGHGTVSSNQAMIQPMSTLPQMTPPSTSSEDTSSVMLKVYGLRKIIIFPFPLASGINELKGEVAMRLDLQKDSFDMNYKDDEGENIFIPLDKDLRYYLTKRTSSVNSVIKLWVVNNDANPTNLCGSCGGSLMR